MIEISVCNFHINSTMLRKAYEIVTSFDRIIPRSSMPLYRLRSTLLLAMATWPLNGTSPARMTRTFMTSLCTEVVEAVLTAVSKLREVDHRISYSVGRPCARWRLYCFAHVSLSSQASRSTGLQNSWATRAAENTTRGSL